MKKTTVLLFLCLCIHSCITEHNSISYLLDEVESFIEDRPDSALAVLENINMSKLQADKQKAHHSLLYSIALDKNYIDKTDFSILQPAIDYYLKKGNETEKLRTYYYMGRIYSNGGNDEKAMESFVHGLKSSNNTTDYLTVGRMLFAKAQIHNKIYEFEKFSEEMMKASEQFKKCYKQSSYFNSLTQALRGLIITHDTSGIAEHVIRELQEVVDTNDISQLIRFYSVKIHYSMTYKSNNETEKLLDECIDLIPPGNAIWLTIANHYLESNQYENGIEAINKYNQANTKKNSGYYAIASELYEMSGNTVSALENYKMYIKLSDSADMEIFRKDTKFIEERHKLELDNIMVKKRKDIIAIIFLTLLAVLAAVLLWLRNRLKLKDIENTSLIKAKEDYKILCNNLTAEKETLIIILNNSKGLDSDIRNAIENRLSILNKFIKAYLLNDWSMTNKAEQELEKMLNDKTKFIRDNKLVIQGNYPAFIKYLQNKGLTEKEIDFCCLYTMGLKAVHIGQYMGTTNIYNISSSIRKKLGIDEYKTNLDKHIEIIKNKTA
ncbi:MAG: hypothetical protein J6Q34_06230 [Bacteroidales bacterium]|nr:hypothetical protein [Bacteroidales bacterium]